MISESMAERIEELAEQVVMIDAEDLRALADLHSCFQSVAKEAAENAQPDIEKAVSATGDFVESLIMGELPDADSAVAVVCRVVELLQSVSRDGDAASIQWPPELGLSAASDEAAASTAKPDAQSASAGMGISLPANVDESIFNDFLTTQTSVVEEMESLLLRIESDNDGETLKAYRRLVHTMKGETGLLGLGDVAGLCHALEDALEKAASPQQLVETLLKVKDWLSLLFAAYRGEGPAPRPVEEMMALLHAPTAATATTQAPEPAPQETPVEQSDLPAPFDPSTGDLELLTEFVAEAREHLENADVNLLTLETDPDETESLNAVFRAFHTIKGVAGMLALEQMQWLAHEAENLLDKVRKSELDMAGPVIDAAFDGLDGLKKLVSALEEAIASSSLMDPDPTQPPLIAHIHAVSLGEIVEPEPEVDGPDLAGKRLGAALVEAGVATHETIVSALNDQIDEKPAPMLGEVMVRTSSASRKQVEEALERQAEGGGSAKLGETLVATGASTKSEVGEALARQQRQEKPKLGEVLVRSGKVSAKEVAQTLRKQKAQANGGPRRVREAVKVDADRLDRLVDMVGELVIAESMVSQAARHGNSSGSQEMMRHLGQLDKITRELQEIGMSMRMVPIRATFQKMARLVRDLAKKSGKRVEFRMSGEDTELDKTVVDKVGDPLVHMVRNAVDHGLEGSEKERVEAGKSEMGYVQLRAFHKGGSIIIEISDDGRGLNRDAILSKAKERGLLKEDATPSDREIWNLIFEPGFSTAAKVTDVSGRGVGMDVVRRNIDALHGQVDIQSEAGKGSIFSIRLPLTLAIIDGMIVRVGQDRFILPTLSIVRSLQPRKEDLSKVAGHGEVLVLQERIIPLFRMSKIFNVADAIEDASEAIAVVVEDDQKRVAFLVDELVGQQQIVIKSLGTTLQNLLGIAGGAVMPDGTVGLILDIGGLIQLGESGGDLNILDDTRAALA